MITTMCLGTHMFQSLEFGYTGVRRDLSTKWAEIQVAGGLNRLQWTGGDGETSSIEGVLFPHEFGGLATLDQLRNSATLGLVLPWITLAGDVFGMHTIEGVASDETYHDKDGRPRKNVYSIKLRRYTGGSFSPIAIVQTLFG